MNEINNYNESNVIEIQGIVLDGAIPLDDGLRSYNILYWIIGIIGFICGFIQNGMGAGAALGLVGCLIAFVIKAAIAQYKMDKLRFLEFYLPDSSLSDNDLLRIITAPLTNMGMRVEMNSNGSACITHKRIIYDVNINRPGNNTFTLWWRFSILKSFVSRTKIPYYRQAVITMGLIAYTIQDEVKKLKISRHKKNFCNTFL